MQDEQTIAGMVDALRSVDHCDEMAVFQVLSLHFTDREIEQHMDEAMAHAAMRAIAARLPRLR